MRKKQKTMASKRGGRMTIQKAIYRPCYVNGRKALFHKWITHDLIDYAIVEFEDGTADIAYMQCVRFVPLNFKKYGFTDERGGK